MEQALISKVASWMLWTKGKRVSEEDENHDHQVDLGHCNLLLSLLHPDVTNIVLDYLDPKSLLALRQVCKRTKCWVDQPRFLSKLKITLHSSAGSKRMRKVLRSKVDFCNFRIGWEKRNNEDLILEFGMRYGPCLRILDINTMTNHVMLVNLLSLCPLLETVALLGINLSGIESSDVEELQRLTPILGSLKALSVGNVLFTEETEMSYFRRFLEMCCSLQSLRLPYVNFQAKRPKEMRDDILAKYVLDPVIESIRNRAGKAGNMKFLILEYLNPLSPSLFYLLAQVCFENGIIIHNVHESHLRKLKATGADKVQQIIGTLDGLNENILLGKLSNVKCISIWVSAATGLTEPNYADALLPRLKNINLYVDTVEEDTRVNRLISTILGQPRPTVQSLKISYNSRKGAISAELVKAMDIAKHFQYLRKLDIYQWDAFDEEFLILWKGLGSHRIQDLSLLLCTNLSDKGLLGWDSKKPAILGLTGLKELHISSLYGSITDATIYKALRHLPLLKLRLYSQSITYDGIASLLDGVIYKTIQYIHCSKPLDCSQKEFYYLVKDIVNAKNYPDFNKRKPLRRRSQPFVVFDPSDEDEED